MSDTNNNPENVTSDEMQNTEQVQAKPETQAIPYDRFQEVIAQRNQLKARLEALERAETERQQAKLAQDGEYQKLIEQLQPQAIRAEQLENTLRAYLDLELQAIPEDYHDLVPDGDIAMQLDWIRKGKEKGLFGRVVATPPPPPTDGGAGIKREADPTESAKTDGQKRLSTIARQFGYLK